MSPRIYPQADYNSILRSAFTSIVEYLYLYVTRKFLIDP